MGYMGQNVSAGYLRDMIGLVLAILVDMCHWTVNVYMLYCMSHQLRKAGYLLDIMRWHP